jgi:hypothetical protein
MDMLYSVVPSVGEVVRINPQTVATVTSVSKDSYYQNAVRVGFVMCKAYKDLLHIYKETGWSPIFEIPNCKHAESIMPEPTKCERDICAKRNILTMRNDEAACYIHGMARLLYDKFAENSSQTKVERDKTDDPMVTGVHLYGKIGIPNETFKTIIQSDKFRVRFIQRLHALKAELSKVLCADEVNRADFERRAAHFLLFLNDQEKYKFMEDNTALINTKKYYEDKLAKVTETYIMRQG